MLALLILNQRNNSYLDNNLKQMSVLAGLGEKGLTL